MPDWRKEALAALDDARESVEKADGDSHLIILMIESADLLKERPITVFANVSKTWVRRVTAFAAWRFSLWETDETDRAAEHGDGS